jgi:transposase
MTKSERSKRTGYKKNSRYSEAFKKQIATTVIKENLTIREASLRFDVPHQTINVWVLRLYDEIEQTTVIASMKDIPGLPAPEPQFAEYESKLILAQLKITALETMIEVAEETYKIDIRKNVGTKQPK